MVIKRRMPIANNCFGCEFTELMNKCTSCKSIVIALCAFQVVMKYDIWLKNSDTWSNDMKNELSYIRNNVCLSVSANHDLHKTTNYTVINGLFVWLFGRAVVRMIVPEGHHRGHRGSKIFRIRCFQNRHDCLVGRG